MWPRFGAAAPRRAPEAYDEGGIKRGMMLAVVAFMVFGAQDGLTKHLVQTAEVAELLVVRFVAFAVFVTWWIHRRSGLKRAMKSRRPWLQIARSALLVGEIAVFATAVRHMPLADMHAVFAAAPLIVTALAAPMLGEQVGPRRWAAVAAGFVGVLIILRPGAGVMAPGALMALVAAAFFALYVVMTRMAGRTDTTDTSVLYLGWTAAAVTLAVCPFYWTGPSPADLVLMGCLAVSGVIGHVLFIMALEAAPAAVLQPFQYTVLVWAAMIGFFVWGDAPDAMTVLGAGVVVASGLYTLYRERVRGVKRV
ncbi:MAG: DMT family transporter [Rhodospirillales bacterium]